MKSLEFFLFSQIDQVILILRNVFLYFPPSYWGDSTVTDFITSGEQSSKVQVLVLTHPGQSKPGNEKRSNRRESTRGATKNTRRTSALEAHFPSLCWSADVGDGVKRQWKEMEIQTHEGDGGIRERRGASVVWLLSKAQVRNNFASHKLCLQGQVSKPPDTGFCCGKVWPSHITWLCWHPT